MRPVSIAAVALLVELAGCQSATQWTKPEGTSADSYRDDLSHCQDEAMAQAAYDLSAMPVGPDRASAMVVQRTLHFNSCMEDRGYLRLRPETLTR
jgi:hypothetical protein